MNSKFIKKGMAVFAMASVLVTPVTQVIAAEATSFVTFAKQDKGTKFDANALFNAVAGEKNKSEETTIKLVSSEEIKLNTPLSTKVFGVTGEEGYLVVNASDDENSEPVGKVYEDTVMEIVKSGDDWTQITSGNVTGYIKTENVISGRAALEKVKEILSAKYPDTALVALDGETIENSFSVAESSEEEAARLAAEEAKRIAEEQARIAAEQEAARQARIAQGQAVVDYARQFVGNPYVYGGTSLTRGTDCSGFVMSVYAHFGFSLPHSSAAMRNVGYAVSYDEILPGDIVCYPGHVGIYIGNGQIVNAIDESRGIGISNARYTNIITIRRMY